MIMVPSGPIVIQSGTPYTYSISLSYLPASPVTVTPYSSTFIFDPPTITFSDSLYALLTVTPTTPSGYSLFVFYNVSAPGQEGIGLSSVSTQFISLIGIFPSSPPPLSPSVSLLPLLPSPPPARDSHFFFFFVYVGEFLHSLDSYEVSVGAKSDVLTIVADPEPTYGVTLTPTSPTCLFTPPSLVFTPTSPAVSFTFTCLNPGASWVRFIVSGQDAVHYETPSPASLLVSQSMFLPSTS